MENKKITKNKKGETIIEVITENDLIVPIKGKKFHLGSYKNKVINTIPKKNESMLKIFLSEQEQALETQLGQAEQTLEKLQNVSVGLIPEENLKVLKEDLPQALTILSTAKNTEIKSLVKIIRNNLMKLSNLDKWMKESEQKKVSLVAKQQIIVQLEQLRTDLKSLN